MCFKNRRMLCLALEIQPFFSMALFSCGIPFIVQLSQKKGISVFVGSILLSSWNYSSFFVGGCTGKLFARFGRKNVLVFTIVFSSVFTILFSLLHYVENMYAFLFVGFIFRFLGGMMAFLSKQIPHSLNSQYFRQNFQMISLFHFTGISAGVGAGVFLGNYLYQVSGENMILPFSLISVLNLLLSLPLALKYIPQDEKRISKNDVPEPSVNENDFSNLNIEAQQKDSSSQIEKKQNLNEEEAQGSLQNMQIEDPQAKQQQQEQASTQKKVFPIKYFFTNCNVLTLCGVLSVYIYTQQYFQSYLPTELKEVYNESPVVISLFLATRPVFTIAFSWFTPCIRKKLSRKVIALLMFSLQTLGMSFVGPSTIFAFPQSKWLIFSGLALKGVSDGLIFSILLPQIVFILGEKYQQKYSLPAITDSAAGIHGIMTELGSVFAHFLGPILSEKIGFRHASNIAFFLSLIFTLLIAFCGGIIKKENCKKKGTVQTRT